MTNDALCKVLCHNICCLIQSQCELGIVSIFWGKDEPEPEPATAALESPEFDPIDAFAWM